VILLDGPMGTRLEALGVPTPAPLWSAAAIDTHPDVIARIHREYAEAGATHHTAATFRTKRRQAGARWEALADAAVALCRRSIPPDHRVLGSVAPLEDCWRPDLSPADPRPEHRELARRLATSCDVLLCETFAHVGEALVACEECVATGLPTWVSFTAGYDASLLTPEEIARGAREAVQRGASAVLANCIPADDTLRYVERIADLGVPFGAYANAGAGPIEPRRYADLAERWAERGASIVGSCCGTGPEHVRELARRFGHRK
jgi:S-methylmethionine-dependent homocysteine/selenocysteine methylase